MHVLIGQQAVLVFAGFYLGFFNAVGALLHMLFFSPSKDTCVVLYLLSFFVSFVL